MSTRPSEIALSTLTAPLVVEGVTTSQGTKTLVFVVPTSMPSDSEGSALSRLPALVLLVALVACGGLLACHGGPSSPGDGPLATGRWMGSGACLSVTEIGCDLAVGCGHGQFPRPMVRTDGTFDVDGTYRIEVGPVSIDPAPPAHFSGSVTGSRMILNVVPTGSLPPASYSMTATSAGTCPVPCV